MSHVHDAETYLVGRRLRGMRELLDFHPFMPAHITFASLAIPQARPLYVGVPLAQYITAFDTSVLHSLSRIFLES
jgi:hypothetical protein